MKNSKYNTLAISELSLQNHQCFPSDAPELKLDKLTFVYGPNGSGKSTILREMGQHSVFTDGVCELRAFDQKFIRNLLNPDHKFAGVLRVIDGPDDVSERLRELNGAGGEIELAQSKLEGLENTLLEKQREANAAEQRFQNQCWDAKKAVPATLKEAGLKEGLGRKQNLADQVKQKFRSGNRPTLENTKSFGSLEVELQELGTAGEPELPTLPTLPRLTKIDGYIRDLFNEELVPDTSNELSKLIENIGNADWVKQGVAHLDQTDSCCPFCQQELSESLIEKIRSLFSENYDAAVSQIEQLRDKFLDYRGELNVLEEELKGFPERIVSVLKVSIAEHSTYASTIIERANEKLNQMSVACSIDGIDQPDVLAGAYKKASEEIDRVNASRRNMKEARARITNEIFDRFAAEKLEQCWNSYKTDVDGAEKAVKNLKKEVSSAKAELESLNNEARRLAESVSSTKHVMDDVNQTLKALGFSNFHLAPLKDEDSYKVVRSTGALAGPTLSEGEKTLVSFLYFFHSLETAANDKTRTLPLVGVIDDPISSLDSETLFVISVLCKQLIDTCLDTHSRLCQLLFLTHNAYFFKEITYQFGKPNDKGRLYYTFRKQDGSVTQATEHKGNPIVSTYEQLWADLRNDKQGDVEDRNISASTQNTMRRILETYFGSIGGFREDLLKKMEPGDQLAAQSLLAWANDGSHNIPWEVDYAPAGTEALHCYTVFRKIFEVEGQLGHYKKMMREVQ